ncbi:MAG: aromatic ring-hydroxylating dioxygenase subunit alpha [Streptomycetaceae bacterium]|nr:aromatic ring-hydroxylating dioxygenase subunit alpha [Streptomycetaceae bacterium]
MDRRTERDLVGRVIDMAARRTTTLADTVLRIPADTYVSPDHFARERDRLFRERPVFACLSADVPNPGDHLALSSGGVPILVVRAPDGGIGAYVNACRHRGSPLVRGGPGNSGRALACPFHRWVYDTGDGRLLGQPRSCGGFDELLGESLGLLTLPVAERYGIVVVRPSGDEPVDIDTWLAGFAPQFAAHDYAALLPYTSATTTWACNWKLLLDTFFENYHVFALHRGSLGAFYLSGASPFDAYGPHNRFVVPRSSLLDQAERPREEWELGPHAVLQYFLAPGIIISNVADYVMTWRFTPDAADATTVEHALYTYRPADTDEDRKYFDERFDAAESVTVSEDFPESELIHRNLASGLIPHTHAGRNEPGIVHFHRTMADELEGP